MRRWIIPLILTLGLFADWMLLNYLYNTIGFANTLLIVVLFIPWGLYLQFSQGAAIRDQLFEAFRTGQRIPETALEGVMVMIGGVMMIVPGVLSSLLGLAMVLPWSRRLLRPLVVKGFSMMLPEVGAVGSGASVFGSAVRGSGFGGSAGSSAGSASGSAAGFGSTGFGADVVDANPQGPRAGSGSSGAGRSASRPASGGSGWAGSGRTGSSGRKSIEAEVVNIERNDRPGA